MKEALTSVIQAALLSWFLPNEQCSMVLSPQVMDLETTETAKLILTRHIQLVVDT